MPTLTDKLKALIAAAVSFACTWAAARYPQAAQILTPELQASIVGIVMGFAVYFTPNVPVPPPVPPPAAKP